ncbi:peptidylprolyl isomerase [Clostridium vincentii]|uniref:Peptidyl-prolyl cis-trans isomerase n=1 Tax=Clostridium vincentii TaxID=52704 RepID=A0A2T0BC47_9CLOT|nr:peptidylprolyl isomerase [Clostridium vincentii]PRR81464.1 putative peptidyl-prolyl cis-trans isomerase [Clostridium vincentii]
MKNKLFKVTLITTLVSVLFLVGCGNSDDIKTEKIEEWGEEVAAPKEVPVATIKIKDFGTVKAELYPQYATNTVNNFISLANSGFYNGTSFHRIIEDFMIQGGDPEGTGQGGPGYNIKGEFSSNGYMYNTLEHEEGVLSMARTSEPDTAGSQFFIVTNESNAAQLNGEYATFGKVIEGMDIVHKISETETGKNGKDKPDVEVIIESIEVDLKGVEYDAPEKV